MTRRLSQGYICKAWIMDLQDHTSQLLQTAEFDCSTLFYQLGNLTHDMFQQNRDLHILRDEMDLLQHLCFAT